MIRTTAQDAPWRVLDALYVLARADQSATRTRIADHTKLTIADVGRALDHLESKQLANAKTCRLSLLGFAMMHAYRTKNDPRILTLAA